MTTAQIAYQPHIHQARVHASAANNKVVVAGRQSGKTLAVVNEVAEWAMSAPKRWPDSHLPQFWWVTASYKTKPKAWRDFNRYIPKEIVRQVHESEAWIELRNGSRITFRSADGREALVSETLHGLVCDEAGQYSPVVYDQLLGPMTSTTGGPQILLGTPRGYNWFWEKYQLKAKGAIGWDSFRWRTADSPYVTASWLADQRILTPERIWRQEYEAEFLTDGGEVFRNIDAAIGPASAPDPYTVLGLDLARTHDWTYLMAFNSTGAWVDHRRVGHLDWSVQRVAVIEMYRRLKCAKVVLDATGIQLGAEAVVLDLQREGLAVEPVHITGDIKRALIEGLMLRFDLGSVRIPMEAADEFREYTFEQMPSGYQRYSAPEGRHDDAVMAAALAMWGLRQFAGRPMSPKPETDLQRMRREVITAVTQGGSHEDNWGN